MARKEKTEAEKKAWGEKMKAAREAKKNGAKVAEETTTSQAQTAAPRSVTIDEDKFNQLMDRLNKLEDSRTKTVSEAADSGFDKFGKPMGMIQKYSLDASHYANPIERLLATPELQRYALKENYELTWLVDQTIYETKFGTTMADPKFNLTLKKKIYDASGELTDRKIIVQTGVFFEDPAASIQEALQLGLPIDDVNSPEFMEQMRYLRFKQWLVDIFNPQLPKSTKAVVTDQVIDGVVYQIEDYSVVV
jgi:tetrahydromethanopterin S-methyltransferase subunit G